MQKSARQNSASRIACGSRNERAKISGARTKTFFTHCFGRVSLSKEYAVLGMKSLPNSALPYQEWAPLGHLDPLPERRKDPMGRRSGFQDHLAKGHGARYTPPPHLPARLGDSLTVEQPALTRLV